jgi:class 3 adenylate cyclase/tetratricopeptide (TPR) repeat protein
MIWHIISRVSEGSIPPDQPSSRDVDRILESIRVAPLAELMAIWRARDSAQWSEWPRIYRAIAERVLHQGEPLLAYDIIREALNNWPNDVRLRQLQGLSLARSGASERANVVLESLREEGETDVETLGMLGRTYKDLATVANPPQREKLLRRAAEIYGEAYKTSGGYWTGINAATMNLLIGEKDLACRIAEDVRVQCLEEVRDPRGDSYWELAALGEAALICRDLPEAEKWYSRAVQERKTRFGDLQSSRRNARLILNYWNEDGLAIEQVLHVPSVIVFAGHMVDRPDRSAPRFPMEIEPMVAEKIKAKVHELKPGFGFASAACGSDILFLEAMLEYGAEVSIVLPYNYDEFVEDSIAFVPESNWRARCDQVLKRAARVLTISTQRIEMSGVSYEFCNQMLLGLASIRSRQLDTELVPLAVWNGKRGDGPGGAATVVENWGSLGLEPVIIGLPDTVGEAVSFPGKATIGGNETSKFSSRIVAVLFADAVGFSKLTEREVPRFVEHFFGAIAKLSDNFRDTILVKNTWGDGLYYVFSDVLSAGGFALELARVVTETKWEEKGLRPSLTMRIGLHAGPAYEFDDPITGNRTYSGTHVSQAARIEPITPPGQVYASEAFAALAAAHRAKNFTCDYVGQTPLAKDYGTLPTYHVRAKSAGGR